LQKSLYMLVIVRNMRNFNLQGHVWNHTRCFRINNHVVSSHVSWFYNPKLRNLTLCKPLKLIFISVSTPAIAGIVVFAVVFISAILMSIFYRRRKSQNRLNCCRKSPSQAVKHIPITVETSTYQLTSARPIPAAPDYSKFGLGRRTSNNNMLPDNSSSEKESFSTKELVQKFDWSSPGRRRKNFPSDEDVADILDGMYKSINLY